MIQQNSISDIRLEFARLLKSQLFTNINREPSMMSLMGNKTIEIIGASFIADEDVLFGKVNHEYLAREEHWYKSMSLNVNDIPGGAPTVWQAIASKDGTVNSNYGYCIYSSKNGNQFDNVIVELKKNPESRRATMIYIRPSMWNDYNFDGRSDFLCTTDVQYLIRDGFVNAVVRMRSNDACLGYRNDVGWQRSVLKEVSDETGFPVGKIYWHVGSLHVYERNFYLVDHFAQTGEIHITKTKYKELYHQSHFLI